MTTYRQGQGYRIKLVTSDPDNAKVGQVWYNSTELKIKGKLILEIGSKQKNQLTKILNENGYYINKISKLSWS